MRIIKPRYAQRTMDPEHARTLHSLRESVARLEADLTRATQMMEVVKDGALLAQVISCGDAICAAFETRLGECPRTLQWKHLMNRLKSRTASAPSPTT